MNIPKCFNKRCYVNTQTKEQTTNASIALKWHHNGDAVQFYYGYDNINDLPLFQPTIIRGVYQAPKPDENREHCKSIANDIDKYVDGAMYTCPDCGEVIEMPETVGDKFKCPCCGLVEEVNEYHELSIYDYLIDTFDIEYRIGSDKELRSVCIMVACGGPNIYLDTASKNVELYWWSESAKYPLSYAAVDAINEYAEELYQCL